MTTSFSTSATAAAARIRATAADASTWSVPSSGISQNEVRNVPAIDPAVETANSRPAVLPRFSIERAFRRTATGDTLPRTTLGNPKRRMVAITGFNRGPGSQATTRSRIQPSTNGIASTSSAPAPRMPTSRRGVG